MTERDRLSQSDPYLPLDLDLLPPEMSLLVTAARVCLGTASQDALGRCLARPMNYTYLLQAGNWHRLHAVLIKMILDGGHEGLPKEVHQVLEEGYRGNAARNLKLTSLLFGLLGSFNDANIPVLVLKGLALAGPLYGDIALRRSGDLDILVHPRDVEAAMNLMCRLDHCSSKPMDRRSFDVLMATDNEMKLQLSGELVELQWRLGPFHKLYPAIWEDLISEAGNVSMSGRGVPTLGKLEMLPYLCFHGTKHMWYRLFWLMDVAAWLRWQKDWCWKEALARAAGRGQQRALLLGLAFSHHLFDSPLPDEMVGILTQDPSIARRVVQLRDMMLVPQEATYEIPVSNATFLRNLYWMCPGISQRAAITMRYFFTPTIKDYNGLSLPSALSPLYYVTRPIRLALSLFGEPKDDKK